MEKAYDHVTKPVVYNKRDSLIDQMIIRGLITNINWITEKKNNQQQQKQIKQKSTKKPPKIKYLLASKKTWIIIYLTVYSTNWTVHVSWAGAKWRLGGGGILLCRCDKSCHHNCLIFWARAFPVTLFGNSSSKRYNYILIHQV